MFFVLAIIFEEDYLSTFQEYRQEFPPDLQPPTHMPVAFGLVKSKKVGSTQQARGGGGDSAAAVDDDDDDILLLSQVRVPRCAVCEKRMQVHN